MVSNLLDKIKQVDLKEDLKRPAVDKDIKEYRIFEDQVYEMRIREIKGTNCALNP